MLDPISKYGIPAVGPATAGAAKPGATGAAGEKDFASLIREQLDSVSKAQGEADANVEKLVTGQSQNVTDVFVAARKAEVAFSLMMEIRNKLVDAYQELQNMRV